MQRLGSTNWAAIMGNNSLLGEFSLFIILFNILYTYTLADNYCGIIPHNLLSPNAPLLPILITYSALSP